VVTITGTTGFEATMLNKPVIVFGNVFYGAIKGVKFASGFEELENIFKEIELDSELIDNSYHCAAYLKTIHETGTKFNLKDLTNLSEKKTLLKLDKVEEKQFLELLNNFKFFYEKAINIYNNEKK
jgi:capsule polysaccharide export protein KpsC/LpsZ